MAAKSVPTSSIIIYKNKNCINYLSTDCQEARTVAEGRLVSGHKAQVAQDRGDGDGAPAQRVLGLGDKV